MMRDFYKILPAAREELREYTKSIGNDALRYYVVHLCVCVSE